MFSKDIGHCSALCAVLYGYGAFYIDVMPPGLSELQLRLLAAQVISRHQMQA